MQTEMMLIKEKYQCDFCKEQVPIIQIESHEKSCKSFKEKQEKIDKMIKGVGIEYPFFWEKNHQRMVTVSDKAQLVPLDVGVSEWNKVEELFHMSFQGNGYEYGIIDIWRIQNNNLWDKYYREKVKIKEEKNFSEENLLFYGNKTIKTEQIALNGFDISFSVDNAPYGRGIYFYRRADRVIQEAYKVNKKDANVFIFLALVNTGIPYVSPGQNYNLKKPPFYDQSKFIYYDSVTNMDNKSKIKDVDQTYVVYNNEKVYPLYMIEFNHLNKIY